jgi:preprotein translocase subunit SecA
MKKTIKDYQKLFGLTDEDLESEGITISFDTQLEKNEDFVDVGRNDKCPCGSGKKYKKCCLDSGKYERYKEKE